MISSSLAVIYNQTNWLLTKILLGAVSFFAALPGFFFYVRLPESTTARWQKSSSLILAPVVRRGSAPATSSWLIDCGPAFEYDSVLLPFLRSQGSADGSTVCVLTRIDCRPRRRRIRFIPTSCPPKLVRGLSNNGAVHPSLTRFGHNRDGERACRPQRIPHRRSILPIVVLSESMSSFRRTEIAPHKTGGRSHRRAAGKGWRNIRDSPSPDAGPATEKWLLPKLPEPAGGGYPDQRLLPASPHQQRRFPRRGFAACDHQRSGGISGSEVCRQFGPGGNGAGILFFPRMKPGRSPSEFFPSVAR